MDRNLAMLIGLNIAGFLLTTIATWLLIGAASRRGVLDIPNERSSHSSPVPRGGGVAVVISFLAFLLLYRHLLKGSVDEAILISLFLGGAIVAVIGIVDDLKHVSARWRFVIHVSAAILSLSLLPSLPHIQVFGLEFSLGVLGYAFFSVALVWCINLFNFMDGIDGIAGIEAITVLISGALIMFSQGQTDWITLLVFLAICVAGFLVWNWPPAKTFMGDGCSGFLGFMLGLLALITSVDESINVWSWLILFGVFLVDATTTLIRRVTRGQKWYEAHRSHAYQILSRRFESHRKVTLGVLAINVFWLLPLGFLAAKYPYWGLVICCVALLPLLILAVNIGAGSDDRQSA